ncbi:MAG: T9SS type A sorting domain-containing protein [bacterium]|nr:T9SS type A sorting domain-containing protein [bacterium]
MKHNIKVTRLIVIGRLTVVLLLSLSSYVTDCFAQLVYGDQTITNLSLEWQGDETVTLNGHLTICANEQIQDEVSLTIHAGCQIFMAPGSILELIGVTLSANGEEEDSIFFRPTLENGTAGRIIVRDFSQTHRGRALLTRCSFDRIGSSDPDEGMLIVSGNCSQLLMDHCWARRIPITGIIYQGLFILNEDTVSRISNTRIEGTLQENDTQNSDGIRLSGPDDFHPTGILAENIHIENFGYSPGSELEDDQGSAINLSRGTGQNQYQLIIRGNYPGLPLIQNCGNGIKSIRSLCNIDVDIHHNDHTIQEITSLTGCGIRIDETRVMIKLQDLAIRNTALDGIRLRTRNQSSRTIFGPDSFCVIKSSLTNIGRLRTENLTSQSNGFVLEGGTFHIDFSNCYIDSVFNNGIRLCSVDDVSEFHGDGTVFDFERDLALGATQFYPLSRSRVFPTFIQNCGINQFSGLPLLNRPLAQADERHGVRISTPQDVEIGRHSLDKIRFFDVGIGNNALAGIAIRGKGIRINDSVLTDDRFPFNPGRLEVVGCAIDSNRCGIEITDNNHDLLIESHYVGNNHGRTVSTSINCNATSGILVTPSTGSSTIIDTVQIALLNDAGSSFFISRNTNSCIRFTESDASNISGFKNCRLKSIGGVKYEGYRFVNSALTGNGISLESDYADSNWISIVPSQGQFWVTEPSIPCFPPNPPARVILYGFPEIFYNNDHGIYMLGKGNTLYCASGAIHSNSDNGVMLDERATSSTTRDSLGWHTVRFDGCKIYANGTNGILVQSTGGRGYPRSNFGGTTIVLEGDSIYANATLQAAHAGVWIDEAGGFAKLTNCYLSGVQFPHVTQPRYQYFGFRESSVVHLDSIIGGYFTKHISNGVTIDANAYGVTLVTGASGQKVRLLPDTTRVIGAGPVFEENGSSGLLIDGQNQNRHHKIHLRAASFLLNNESGVSITTGVEKVEVNSCRFYANGAQPISNTDANIRIVSEIIPDSLYIFANEIFGSWNGITSSLYPHILAQNIFYNNKNMAVSITTTAQTFEPIIRNNTVLNDETGTGGGFQCVAFPENGTIDDNIVSVYVGNPYHCFDVQPGNSNVRYNIAWCNRDTTQDWSTLTNGFQQGTNINGNPHLFNPTPRHFLMYRFHLIFPSAAFNAGDPDLRDANGTRINIGAFGGNRRLLPIAKNWRAEHMNLLFPNNEEDGRIHLSGTLVGEEYQAFSTCVVDENDVLYVEPGVDIWFANMSRIATQQTQTDPDSFILKGSLQVGDSPDYNLLQFQNYDNGALDSMWFRLRYGRWVESSPSGNFVCDTTTKTWYGMVVEPTGNFGENRFEKLWIDGAIYGLQLTGYSNQEANPVSFHNLRIIGVGNGMGGPTGNLAPKSLYIKHRRLTVTGLEMYPFSKGVFYSFGIFAERDITPNAPSTYVNIDSALIKKYRHSLSQASNFIVARNLGKDPILNDGNSFILKHSKLIGYNRSAVIDYDTCNGIYLINTNFKLERDTVIGMTHANALKLSSIPLNDWNRNRIDSCRFSGSTERENASNSLLRGNGMLLKYAFPIITECDIDSNYSNGVLSYWTSNPIFFGRPGYRGSRIFDNVRTTNDPLTSLQPAQYYHFVAEEGNTPAPTIAWNSIYYTDPVERPQNEYRDQYVIRNPCDGENIPDAYKFTGVWWGTNEDISSRFSGHDGTNLIALIPPNELYRNRLTRAPIDYPRADSAMDMFQDVATGDYATAASRLSNMINDETLLWSQRAHAVPLLFGVNERRGWTYTQNYTLWDSLQARFEGTDMFPVVRNYKPLLELLHDKPEEAYATYQQFQLFPLCFEDSVAAVIAMLELDPVMGPENKRGDAFRDQAIVANLRKVEELEDLLVTHRVRNRQTTQVALPLQFELRNPYPNPFNSVLQFHFTLPSAGVTQYIIFDGLGREVFHRTMGNLQAGKYLASWNGTNASQIPVSSGVYFLKLRSGDFEAVKKVILLK